ncbi:MAG: SDR family oxidoreductase [Myxococcales bacterium]|nr:SDR family oxidoreductase [Myxococcales bacterium]
MDTRCLVIGGSGALGGAVCAALVARGARVAFTWHRNEAAAHALTTRLPGAIALRLDLTDVAAIDRTVDAAADALSGLDALIQCAAIAVSDGATGPAPTARIDSIDEAGFDRMIAVNVKGAFFACRRAAARMERGNLVLVGSIDGSKTVPSPVHYATAKAALAGMVRALTKELGPRGISANLVAPGVLSAGLSRTMPDDLRAEYLKHCGLGRVGGLGEVAALLAWLAVENTYLSGQVIAVDGAL